jgi:hypothetical protein
MLDIFDASKIDYVRGMCPPGWNAPLTLLKAMSDLDFEFVASARDIKTDVSASATTNMSGVRGAPLIHPALMEGTRLVHLSTNFQATSSWERAHAIVESGGLLAIKAHIIKDAMGHVAIDGMDAVYANLLDFLFARLRQEYGDTLWWTTMGEIANHIRSTHQEMTS